MFAQFCYHCSCSFYTAEESNFSPTYAQPESVDGDQLTSEAIQISDPGQLYVELIVDIYPSNNLQLYVGSFARNTVLTGNAFISISNNSVQ